MKSIRTMSVEELQVVSHFEGLRKTLLSEKYADHLEKPLAYWVQPADRRLPLALMGRTLRSLLDAPLSQLSATPGIGPKKMASLVRLLARAANTDPAALPPEVLCAAGDGAPSDAGCPAAGPDGFDPANVSEVTWAKWRSSVVRHGLSNEAIGRFAPSLQNMTRVIWNTPLGAYTSSTLAEIREMRTHGEKRIRALLEVFHALDAITAGMGIQPHLTVRILPRRIDQAEHWIGRVLQRPGVPDEQEIFGSFIEPLLEQIRTDATQQVALLAEHRLGVHGSPISVRQAARTMSLTRARVYQLLNEINDIMMVRWPTGRHLVHELRERLQADAAEGNCATDLAQFYAAVELFYPGSRRGAAGPLEQADEPLETAETANVLVQVI